MGGHRRIGWAGDGDPRPARVACGGTRGPSGGRATPGCPRCRGCGRRSRCRRARCWWRARGGSGALVGPVGAHHEERRPAARRRRRSARRPRSSPTPVVADRDVGGRRPAAPRRGGRRGAWGGHRREARPRCARRHALGPDPCHLHRDRPGSGRREVQCDPVPGRDGLRPAVARDGLVGHRRTLRRVWWADQGCAVSFAFTRSRVVRIPSRLVRPRAHPRRRRSRRRAGVSASSNDSVTSVPVAGGLEPVAPGVRRPGAASGRRRRTPGRARRPPPRTSSSRRGPSGCA